MSNIMDYLDWRGDISIGYSPFNEVDNLILSHLSYVNFDEVVPSIDSDESITIKEASDLFFEIHTEKEIKEEVSLTKSSMFLLKKMAETRRFADMKLSKYVNKIDYDEEKQFSAISIAIDENTIYLAFRGTDDTIVGWKESFNMSFITPVPSQIEAVNYLEKTLGGINKKIIIGGHSKGGNLAIYAAVKCCPSIKDNIFKIYNNDGPGFDKAMIVSKEYQAMLQKIRTIVPQSSIVGMLLEHEEEYVIIKSNQKAIMQHDPMSWEVLGKGFICVDKITKESKLLDAALKAWLNNMDEKEREKFLDSLYYIFNETDVRNLGDLLHDKLRKMRKARMVIGEMEQDNKEVLSKTIRLLFKESNRVLRHWNKIVK